MSPQLAGLFAATTGVGFLMLLAGVQKSMLESPPPPPLPVLRPPHRGPRLPRLRRRTLWL